MTKHRIGLILLFVIAIFLGSIAVDFAFGDDIDFIRSAMNAVVVGIAIYVFDRVTYSFKKPAK